MAGSFGRRTPRSTRRLAVNTDLNVATVLKAGTLAILINATTSVKLTHEAKQAEKAVKGLQSMIRRLETQILNHKSQLDEVEEKLASGRITLDKYDARKTDLLKLIAEYQTKLDDKAGKLQAKEQELDRMTRDMERVGWIAQPFRNHQIDFDPPRIASKPPMFGVDKWLDEQNRSIASRFVKIVRQIEALYRKDAEQQVQAVQRNALVDYQELKRLQQENMRLTDLNGNQTAPMQEFIDQMAEPSVRERIFSIADALIGGQPVAVSSGGGGGNSDSYRDLVLIKKNCHHCKCKYFHEFSR